MGALLSAGIGSRFGLAGIVAVLAALVVGTLWLDRAGLRADVAEAQSRAAELSAEIARQNAAVEAMRADALAASRAAAARATAALKPRPKPDLSTIEELNTWLVTP